MKSKRFFFSIFILSVALMTACSSEQAATIEENAPTNTASESTPSDTKQVIYSNIDTGLVVYQTDGWTLEKETETDKGLNITFGNEKVKGILTIISTDKSFDDIKNELKIGAGKVEIIDESDEYLAFKSLRKESMRTDIYINRLEEECINF